MSDVAEARSTSRLSAKDEVRTLLDRLPDDVTLEDIAYHLDVVIKVLEAEAQLGRGEGIPHDQVFREFEEKWRGQRSGPRSVRRDFPSPLA